MSTWAELTISRLRDSAITEAQLRKARAILSAALSGRAQRTACSEGEAWDVITAVDDMRAAEASPVIRGEWCDKAAAYLQRLTFRKDGEMRANAWTRQLSRGDAETLRAVDHFNLYALDAIDRGRGFYYVEPVFTVYGRNGNGIIYSSTPWQSGGDGPRVVGHVYATGDAQ